MVERCPICEKVQINQTQLVQLKMPATLCLSKSRKRRLPNESRRTPPKFTAVPAKIWKKFCPFTVIPRPRAIVLSRMRTQTRSLRTMMPQLRRKTVIKTLWSSPPARVLARITRCTIPQLTAKTTRSRSHSRTETYRTNRHQLCSVSLSVRFQTIPWPAVWHL